MSVAVALASVVEEQAVQIAALTVAYRDQSERLRVLENTLVEVRQTLRQAQLQQQAH